MSKLPSVVSSIPQDLKAFVNQVREALDGRNGEKLVTVNDLIRGGLAAPGPSNTIVPPAGAVGTPATPKNVQASGAIQNIIVTWDDPLYNGHAYAEVWSSSTDDLGAAVQVGMTPGAIFVDAVGPSVIRYYWVRFVNVLGVQGAFNAVAGVQGETGSDVAYLLDTLTDAALDPDSDYTKFAVRADFFYVMPSPDFSQEDTPTATAVGDIWYQPSTELVRVWTGSIWGPFVQSLPFIVNSSPQTINGVEVPAGVYMDAAFIKNGTITNAKIGNAAIDDAKIANLSATKITAGTISADRIASNSITADKIDSRNLTIRDSSNNIIFSSGGTSYLNVSGLGSFATLNTITPSNITTYIQNASIDYLSIKGNAVTVPVANRGAVVANVPITISLPVSGLIFLSVGVQWASGTTGPLPTVNAGIFNFTDSVWLVRMPWNPNTATQLTAVYALNATAGKTYVLQGGTDSPSAYFEVNFVAIGAIR
jgi:hypothetical protein